MVKRLFHSLPNGLIVLLLVIILSSCDMPCNKPSCTTRTGNGASPVIQEQPIQVSHRPFLTDAIWFDVSSSVYPSETFTRALLKTADAIDAYIEPNEDGAVFYIGNINNNSFRPESVVKVISVPPLPADPPRPVPKPLPPLTNNPYQDSQAQHQIEQENDQALRDWQTTLQRNHKLLAQVRQQVRAQTQQIRKLAPPVDNTSTDIFGALERSSLWFESAPKGSKKMLLLEGSDLENNTLDEDIGTVQLADVHTRILFHICEDAPVCLSNDAYWRKILSQDGVKDLLILDPASSQAYTPFFS